MRRPLITTFAATLAFGVASASAQDRYLAGVTMRVLDDVSDNDAVVLELDANRGEDEGGEGRAADEADSAERNAAETAEAEESRLDERREREELHDPDEDERTEGELEDNDIERPAAAPTP